MSLSLRVSLLVLSQLLPRQALALRLLLLTPLLLTPSCSQVLLLCQGGLHLCVEVHAPVGWLGRVGWVGDPWARLGPFRLHHKAACVNGDVQ